MPLATLCVKTGYWVKRSSRTETARIGHGDVLGDRVLHWRNNRKTSRWLFGLLVRKILERACPIIDAQDNCLFNFRFHFRTPVRQKEHSDNKSAHSEQECRDSKVIGNLTKKSAGFLHPVGIWQTFNFFDTQMMSSRDVVRTSNLILSRQLKIRAQEFLPF